VVDSLLHSLDALRVLTEERADPQGVDVDFESLVAEMDSAIADQTGGPDDTEVAANVAIAVTDDVIAEVQQQIDSSRVVFKVMAQLEEGSAFGAVRFFQLHSELNECGKIITSSPSEEQIQAEKVSTAYSALIGTDMSADDLRERVASVQEITNVTVNVFDPNAVAVDDAPVEASEKQSEAQ
jgi:transcriptional regulator NrdR family protein